VFRFGTVHLTMDITSTVGSCIEFESSPTKDDVLSNADKILFSTFESDLNDTLYISTKQTNKKKYKRK
jgi:hypothetical protein